MGDRPKGPLGIDPLHFSIVLFGFLLLFVLYLLLPRAVRKQYFGAYPKRHAWSARSRSRRSGRSYTQVSRVKPRPSWSSLATTVTDVKGTILVLLTFFPHVIVFSGRRCIVYWRIIIGNRNDLYEPESPTASRGRTRSGTAGSQETVRRGTHGLYGTTTAASGYAAK